MPGEETPPTCQSSPISDRSGFSADEETPPTADRSSSTTALTSQVVSPYIAQRINSLFGDVTPSGVELTDSHDFANNNNNNLNVTPVNTKSSQSLKNKKIEFKCSNTNETVSGTIINRAGKATGKYSNAYNIRRDDNGECECVDLDRDVDNWRLIDNDEEVLILLNSNEVYKAKVSEIDNWNNNDVYNEVLDEGQNTISVKWVVTEKLKDGNSIIKARLVARGFEENTETINTYSPTCHKESFRLALAIIAANNWKCHSIDIKAAFLQGHKIDRDIYLKPPKEFYKGFLWKLNKTVYGLNDAARAWYLRVKSELINLGLNVCSLDQAIFYWHHNEKLEGIICLHVDDFCWAGNEIFKYTVVDKIGKLFLVGSTCDDTNFKYIGLDIKQNEENITLDQLKYVSSIDYLKLKDDKDKQRILGENEKHNFKSLIGQLNWVATQTRPDVLFDVSDLSSKYNNAKVEDCSQANKVFKNILNDNVIIKFPKSLNLSRICLEGYSDASFANLINSGSQSGYIIYLTDGVNKCPLLWQSRRIKRVVRSTLAAETMALIECAEASVYLGYIINEILLKNKNKIKINCFVDNKSLVDTISSQKLTDDRHLRINMACLNDLILKENVVVHWVQSGEHLANCLTKHGVSSRNIISSFM